jgi:outer membrane protein TolC
MPTGRRHRASAGIRDPALIHSRSQFAVALLEALVRKTPTFWAAAVAVAITIPASAQEKDHVKELIAQAMQQAGQTTPAVQPASNQQPGGPLTPLSADEAVRRALERNLDIQVARLEPQLLDYQVAALWANYRPSLTSSLFTQGQTNLPADQLQGGVGASANSIINDTAQWNAGLIQNFRWGGGNAAINFNNTRLETTQSTALRNPAYTSNFQAQYTQPLLRNFRIDQTRSNLLINQLQSQITDLNLRSTLTITEAAVRNAYWDLVFGIDNVEAARRNLELSSKLVQDNRAKVEIGTMAPIDVVQAQAEEATRRQALVTAEATRRTNELALKRLIVGGTDDDLWNATLSPTDRPGTQPEAIDIESAVRNALANRADIAVAKRNLEQNEVGLRNLRNSTLPALDVIGLYNLQGRGGPLILRETGGGIGGGIIGTVPGGYFDALSSLGSWAAPTWSVRLNLTYPIGQSSAEASYARAKVQVTQTQAQVKQAELIIATEVTNAALNVTNNYEAVQAAAVARELSEQRLQAAQSKFEVGMATNFEVVQAQRDLADARSTELRNILNYRKAIVDFQRSQLAGTSRTVTSIR